MLYLDNNTKEQEEKFLEQEVKNMNSDERENFLTECADYFLYFDEYTQNPEKKE